MGVVRCTDDGSDFEYSESVSGDVRTISTNHCPNHPTYNLNPNYAVGEPKTYSVPAFPSFVGTTTASGTASAPIDLSKNGGILGVFFSGAMLFSPYGGPMYGQVTGYETSATYYEAYSFDQCAGHASFTDQASYHHHGPPPCLLRQLGQTDASHSPQVAWAFDGFPIYGPRGPGGVMMQACAATGGTYGEDVCADDCGGYYSADDSIDNFVYRYYLMGTYGDGTSCDVPGCPSPTSAYHPSSPLCLRGCCPSGVSCSLSAIDTCTSDDADGYTASFSVSVPTINGMSLASGLPQNTGGCACGSLACNVPCADSDWFSDECGAPNPASANCPAASSHTGSPTANSSMKFPAILTMVLGLLWFVV